MPSTSELRGEGYRQHQWVDRYGTIWSWDHGHQKWRGNSHGGVWMATEDEVSNYLLFGGRGPFRQLAPDP